jgi:hypothetical protein
MIVTIAMVFSFTLLAIAAPQVPDGPIGERTAVVQNTGFHCNDGKVRNSLPLWKLSLFPETPLQAKLSL